MSFIELAKSRRSVRGFKSDGVSQQLINILLTAIKHAPSAGNCQPWHVHVIKDKEVIQKIRKEACKQAFIATAPLLMVVSADIKLSEARYKKRGRELYCIQDTAAAIQNMLLCAEDLGLGACWCGHFGEKEISEILNLDKDIRPVAVIPIGYPKKEGTRTGRREIKEFTTFI
jgi:nitroreductase